MELAWPIGASLEEDTLKLFILSLVPLLFTLACLETARAPTPTPTTIKVFTPTRPPPPTPTPTPAPTPTSPPPTLQAAPSPQSAQAVAEKWLEANRPLILADVGIYVQENAGNVASAVLDVEAPILEVGQGLENDTVEARLSWEGIEVDVRDTGLWSGLLEAKVEVDFTHEDVALTL